MKPRHRRLLLAIAVASALTACSATSASADTFCIDDATCGVGAGVNFPATEAGLTDALTAAQNSLEDSTILIGDASIDIATVHVVNPTDTNRLTIKGTAGASSVLHFNQTGGGGLQFNTSGSTPGGIQDLSVKMDGAYVTTRRAIYLAGGSAQNVDFDIGASGSIRSAGLTMTGGASCDQCDFRLSGDGSYGVNITGSASITDSTFSNAGGPDDITTGVQDTANFTNSIRNSRFRDLKQSVVLDLGTLNIYDTLIDLGARPSAVGVSIDNPNDGSSYASTIDGVTIVGTGLSQIGVHIGSESSSGTEHATGSVTNSLFALTGAGEKVVECYEGTGGDSQANLNWSLIDAIGFQTSGTGTCSTSGANNLLAFGFSPSDYFIDPAAHDFRLKPGAPVIDSGDPATDTSGRTLDAYLRDRFVHGNTFAAGGQIDRGAAEYQNYPPKITSFDTSDRSASSGIYVVFHVGASDDNGDTLTYGWDFGDGGVSSEQNPSHAYSAPGMYTAKVQVTDSHGAAVSSDNVKVTVTPAASGPPTKVAFGKVRKTFRPKKGAKTFNGFKVVAKKPAGASIPVTSNVETTITLTLRKKGAKVAAGRQTLRIPAGTSYLTFGFRWKAHAVHRGEYAVNAGINGYDPTPARISVNITVGK